MKLKVSEDADCPVDQGFAVLTDYASIEEELRSHGMQITRVQGWQELALGVAWLGRGEIRGKMRQVEAKVTALEPGRMVEVEARIGGMRAIYETRLVPLGDRITRVNVTLDMRPETLSARLLVQSLKLARGRVLDRMQVRLGRDVARMERTAA